MGRRAKKINAEELRNLGFIRRIGELYEHLRDEGCGGDTAGNRQLFFNDYCSLILLYCFNPLIDSLRMLQQASGLEKVGQSFGVKRFSLASFSEAPAVFDPELLKPIAARLAGEIRPMASDPRCEELKYAVKLVDGTLLRVLPKLAMTRYVKRKDQQAYHAWRIHMELQVGMPAPDRFERTGARGDERKNLKRHLKPGCCYVTDRGYHDVSLFNRIHDAQSRYVCRARDSLKYEVVTENPLTQADRDAGILCDQMVKIGQNRKDPPNHPVRLVTVEAEVHAKRTRKGNKPSSGKILLVTDLTAEEAAAEVVGVLYRYRWTIELFFRFAKQMLGLRHLINQRPAGVDIILYCMVIACLMLHLWTGAPANKATLRMIGWYTLGVATLEELRSFLAKENARRAQTGKDVSKISA